MFHFNRIAIAAALLAVTSAATLAQTAPQPNPLRPAGSRAATPPAATPPAAAPATTAEAAPKAKRARSEAQLANDNRMRACGKEWRENKPKLTAAGKTWRVFNVECRARLKAAAGQKT